ncbi:MAG: hypothetical protein M0T79_10535 [Actinomycetota bacterium]|nr:hypothetical protein [Actinomycetota bacterium]
MSGPVTFGWGCLGALFGFLAVFGLPFLVDQLRSTEEFKVPSVWRIILTTLFVLTWASLGSGGALMVGGVTAAKQAMLYGLGWQSIFKGGTQAASKAINLR